MAARAGDRQAQVATRYRIDPLIAFIRATLHRFRLIPDPRGFAEEGSRRKLVMRRVLLHQVAGQLHLDERVVRQVLVEGLHHPVAVDVRAIERHVPTPARIEPADIVIRIPRHIEPMPAPALAIPRRGQQAVNLLLVRVRALVRLKRLDLFFCGRQTRQIERCATQQRPPVRLGRRL